MVPGAVPHSADGTACIAAAPSPQRSLGFHGTAWRLRTMSCSFPGAGSRNARGQWYRTCHRAGPPAGHPSPFDHDSIVLHRRPASRTAVFWINTMVLSSLSVSSRARSPRRSDCSTCTRASYRSRVMTLLNVRLESQSRKSVRWLGSKPAIESGGTLGGLAVGVGETSACIPSEPQHTGGWMGSLARAGAKKGQTHLGRPFQMRQGCIMP